ncbi:tellurite resistance TerB family protein [Rhizobium sp. SG2393]|uniref:tellurite resistance TerB family protein n=1 Tax=Rhizobium sp. SG2393 TaxID=3276279 RepID=UPI00366D7958
MPAHLDTHEALIYAMVTMSAVDAKISDAELARIGQLAQSLPVFDGFDAGRLVAISQDCTLVLSGPEGLDIVLELIREGLPARLADTAYAVCVEVASADLAIRGEEIRFLQLLRDRLGLDKLTCAAIERSAMARFRR